MIQEKAKELYEELKQGKGSASLFGVNYYDEETRKIIEVITNEYRDKNNVQKRHESDLDIKTVREIVEQLLSDKGEIKNSLIAKLTTQRGIPGLTKAMKIEKKVSEQGLPYLTMDKPFPDDFTSILTGVPNREELMKNIIKKKNDFLTINDKSKLIKIKFDDILYIETSKRQLIIHTTNGYEIIKMSMRKLEKILNKDFFRCHNSFIVNLEKINKIDVSDIYINNATIPISKYRRKQLKARLIEVLGDKLC